MPKGNLLIVEDEKVLSDLLKDLLGPHADSVAAAYNGREALDAIEAQTIHAIVCDINMPVMNGIEFIAKMRELGHKHPIIFYTAHGNEVLMREALSYGAFDFLAKPNFDNLEGTVRQALDLGLKSTQPNESIEQELENILDKK